jgi:cell division protein ZapA
MSAKTDTEVFIGGRVFTLSGYESEEYLQKVASYINNKMSEYSKLESYTRQTSDIRNILLLLNVADDYFKAKDKIASLEEDLHTKEKELYDLKHELISAQMKLEFSDKQLKEVDVKSNNHGQNLKDNKKAVR